jgi:DNA-binding transcriptional LysR family regulator
MSDLEEAETAFDTSAANPKGRLRVDFHGSLAMHFVLPHLPQFLAKYPGIELEIGMGDRAVDLVREGIDCVLRVGQLRESSLVARKVASLSQVTCGSTAYLKSVGIPQTLGDLEGQRAVNFFSSVSGKTLTFDFLIHGEEHNVMLKGRVSVNNAEAYVKCGLDGLGLIQVPRYHVERYLADGILREVMTDFRPAPMPVSIMYPHHRQLSRRVRVLVEWVADLMSRGET